MGEIKQNRSYCNTLNEGCLSIFPSASVSVPSLPYFHSFSLHRETNADHNKQKRSYKLSSTNQSVKKIQTINASRSLNAGRLLLTRTIPRHNKPRLPFFLLSLARKHVFYFFILFPDKNTAHNPTANCKWRPWCFMGLKDCTMGITSTNQRAHHYNSGNFIGATIQGWSSSMKFCRWLLNWSLCRYHTLILRIPRPLLCAYKFATKVNVSGQLTMAWAGAAGPPQHVIKYQIGSDRFVIDLSLE